MTAISNLKERWTFLVDELTRQFSEGDTLNVDGIIYLIGVQELGQGQRTFTRKKCDLAFGLKVPSGLSVSLIDADYRGFNDLPRGARATFKRDYFFAGSRGASLTKNWRGARSNDFHIKDRLGVFANVWSACGADVILRSKTAATVKTRRGREAMMMVDSADLTAKTVYRYNFRYRACR